MPLYIVRLDCHLHEGQQKPPRDLALVAAAPDMEKADLHKARRPYFVAGISDWTIVGACFCMSGGCIIALMFDGYARRRIADP